MPVMKKRHHHCHSEPKLFQCTGYGDCNMVFTRSEHLARHARKHTGEKPFKCVVPGCERTFSRFDNMIQHTSTHNKTHDKKRVQNKQQDKTTTTTKIMERTKKQPPKLLAPLLSPTIQSHISLPVSPSAEPDAISYSQRLPSISDYRPTSMGYFSPSLTFLPSPKELGLHDNAPLTPPPAECDQSISSHDSWSTISLPSPSISSFDCRPLTRNLSTVELALPIQDLSVTHGLGVNGILPLTLNEFEALQGISRLYSSQRPSSSSSSSSSSRTTFMCIGGSQVNSFRQHLALAHESSSRLSLQH
ncbi:uncharacterized protein BX664DRAFT_99661 [Halteromyces radiatus]|uniref:uncharacterized protein n=1 Tax=Halteromyces radiatus TaxID=101107 RepID=UPI002220626F|nr:uncharacterized protein BX664DRAFT_99661 [Halteromyces radiatus]KAI8093052.1 hypothetical protein BX664DRAFT_99661 [Halteromyces radiatus]